MKLQEIFSQLTSGELAQISFKDQPAGVINDSNYDVLVNHVNLGLSALHQRFPIRIRSVTLDWTDDVKLFQLKTAFAVSNSRSREEERYILDTSGNPFQGDVLKVERVENEDGHEFPLNTGSRWSISTPSHDQLQMPKNIPHDLRTPTLEVTYRANHPLITVGLGYFDPERVDVDLPYAYMAALVYYVASRVNNPIGLGQEFNAGNGYYTRYEAACMDLEQKGLYIDNLDDHDRFRDGGWI